MAPLKSDPTESFSAMAFAIVSQHEAVRQLEADFDRELALSSDWRRNDAAMDLARGIHDEEPTKVER